MRLCCGAFKFYRNLRELSEMDVVHHWHPNRWLLQAKLDSRLFLRSVMPLSLECNKRTISAVWVESLRKTPQPGRSTDTAGKDMGTVAGLQGVELTTSRLETGRGNHCCKLKLIFNRYVAVPLHYHETYMKVSIMLHCCLAV